MRAAAPGVPTPTLRLMTSEISTRAAALADALAAAWKGGPALLHADWQAAVPDAGTAYAVQSRLWAALGATAGGLARHWKSGGPSRSNPLTHAPLPPAGVLPSGSSLAALPLRHRLVEAEVALVLGRDVSPRDASTLDAAAAPSLLQSMTVTLEAVDSRWAAMREAPGLVKLADLQSHGALVVGALVPFQPRDWAAQVCRVRIGAADWQSFTGTHSLADPTWLLPLWLRHVTRDGATVPAGTLVTTGTWCGLLTAQAGDLVEVDFPGIGSVSAQF